MVANLGQGLKWWEVIESNLGTQWKLKTWIGRSNPVYLGGRKQVAMMKASGTREKNMREKSGISNQKDKGKKKKRRQGEEKNPEPETLYEQ